MATITTIDTMTTMTMMTLMTMMTIMTKMTTMTMVTMMTTMTSMTTMAMMTYTYRESNGKGKNEKEKRWTGQKCDQKPGSMQLDYRRNPGKNISDYLSTMFTCDQEW